MRLSLVLLASGLIASPALAEAGAERDGDLPSEIADPATIDRVTDMVGALSRAMMDLPVGEVEAAIEGRPATRAERRRTLGDIAGRDAERNIDEELAVGRETMQATARSLAAAMPALAKVAATARDEIARAIANLPRPDYPRQ